MPPARRDNPTFRDTALRVVPRDGVWVCCPQCLGPALVRSGCVRCGLCGYFASGGRPGGWCFCCQQWEGEIPAAAQFAGAEPLTVRVHERCPGCGGRIVRETERRRGSDVRPSSCACGATRIVLSATVVRSVVNGDDALFGLPFYLRTRCAGHELWVANRDHLDYLRRFIGTTARRGTGPFELGRRLPGWMTRAGHRATVLAALDRLARRADAARLER